MVLELIDSLGCFEGVYEATVLVVTFDDSLLTIVV